MSDSERCGSSGYRFMVYTDHINAENTMPSPHNAREIDRDVILCYHNPPSSCLWLCHIWSVVPKCCLKNPSVVNCC